MGAEEGRHQLEARSGHSDFFRTRFTPSRLILPGSHVHEYE